MDGRANETVEDFYDAAKDIMADAKIIVCDVVQGDDDSPAPGQLMVMIWGELVSEPHVYLSQGEEDLVEITGVPDYDWFAGDV